MAEADVEAAASLRAASDYSCRAIGFDQLAANEALVRAWEAIEVGAALPTQSYAFSAALSRTLLADSLIQVLLVLGAMGIGALLPLCRDQGYFARWRLAGVREVFEPSDALYQSPEAVHALARQLARESRAVSLDRVSVDSPLVPALEAAMRGRGWLSVRAAVASPTIALDDRWKTPEAVFNAGRRSDFRRAARKAAEFGPVSFETLSPRPDEFDALFDKAIGVEACGWKKEAGSAIAVDREKQAFFRDFFRSACERGQLRIAFMNIGDQTVSMQMAVEEGGRYWLFKIGYDEAYARCSPGTLLMLHTLGDAARRGLDSYELLGNVESWIAALWTREQRGCVRLRTYPYSVRGLVAFAADLLNWLGGRLTSRSG